MENNVVLFFKNGKVKAVPINTYISSTEIGSALLNVILKARTNRDAAESGIYGETSQTFVI